MQIFAYPQLFHAFFSAILFTLLFYQKTWGLNLFIFQLSWLIVLFLQNKTRLTALHKKLFLATLWLTVMAFYHHTVIALLVSFLGFYILSVSLQSESLKSGHFILGSIFYSWTIGFKTFALHNLQLLQSFGLNVKWIKTLLKFIVPSIVIFVFFGLYANANPSFSKIADVFEIAINWLVNMLVKYFKLPVFFTFLGGLILSIPLFFAVIYPRFLSAETKDSGQFFRQRIKHYSFKKMGLKHENSAGVFLLATLNLMLILLLFFEIKDVWFGFSYNGQYLKDFVHEGMHILTVSILFSMVILMYFFRGNLNFYAKNITIKRLAYGWIILNIILVISVLVRDFWYIYYFSLASGRIFLIFLLVACVVGLWSLFQKIKFMRNFTYLLRVNFSSVFILLVVSASVNWDVFIAKYNFNHANRAFLHFDYLMGFDDTALPYLLPEDLDLIQTEQQQQLRLLESSSAYQKKYISAEKYMEYIAQRKVGFVKNYEQKSFLEYNPAHFFTYQKLKR